MRIFVVQGLLILVMAIAALLTGVFAGSFNTGWVRAYSGLAGGLTCLLPGLYSWFRLWVGRGVVRPVNTSLQHAPSGQDVSVQDGTEVARRALVQILTAEAGKWVLTIVLIFVTFRFVQPFSAGWYFGALVLTYGAYILVPLGEYQRQRD